MQRDVPRGTIAFWSGSIATIPTTWRFCDGTRFTPDLRNVFNIGAGDTYAVRGEGGSVLHMHDWDSTGHLHTLTGDTGLSLGTDFKLLLSLEFPSGITDYVNGLSPYHALIPIMYDGRRY